MCSCLNLFYAEDMQYVQEPHVVSHPQSCAGVLVYAF